MLGSIGPLEIGIIAMIVLVLFGPSQLPKLGRSLGQTIKEFRGIGKELTDAQDELRDTSREIRRD